MGFDLVRVSGIADSIARFGEAFRQRVFTVGELQYADSGEGVCAERLAARLAAKEAAIKALKLSDAGVGWRDIEVRKCAEGDCELALHGPAAEAARAAGVGRLLLSLSHDGDYAGAIVAALPAARERADLAEAAS